MELNRIINTSRQRNIIVGRNVIQINLLGNLHLTTIECFNLTNVCYDKVTKCFVLRGKKQRFFVRSLIY